MANAVIQLPYTKNEPVLGYANGSPESETLKAELKRQSDNPLEIPLIIGGKEVKTGILGELRSPHNQSLK